jgi:hypothetical protein
LEVISGVATTQGRQNGDRAPGDYNFDPLGFGKDPAKFKDLQVRIVEGRCQKRGPQRCIGDVQHLQPLSRSEQQNVPYAFYARSS